MRSHSLWLSVLLATLFVAGAARANTRQVALRVHERGGYPDRIEIAPGSPGYGIRQEGPGSHKPSGSHDASKHSRVQRSSAVPTHAPPGSGGLDVVLLGLVLAALLVAFAWLLSRRSPPPVPEGAEVLAPDEATPAPAPPGDPDALAANGRFEDAMRAVLLRALESVGWSAEESAATTAREVVRGLGGADARKQPLGEIVRHAETVHFGGTPATRERYEEMRVLLDRLPLRGSAS